MKKVRCNGRWCTRRRVRLDQAVSFNGKWYHRGCAEWLIEKSWDKK